MSKSELTGEEQQLANGGLGWPALTLLGISFTGAGYYAPWSLALAEAGSAGALLAFGLTAIFYYCLTRSVSELSAAIPSSGAGQAFLDRAFGPAAGFAAGSAALVQWVAGAATILVILGSYVEALTGVPGLWAGFGIYAVILIVLLAGTGEMVAVGLVTALAGIIGVVVFLAYATQSAIIAPTIPSWHPALNMGGIWMALPFCMTFFLGIEGVAFAAEEARNPARDVPQGTALAFLSIIVIGTLLLTIAPAGVEPRILAAATEPITVGLSHVRVSVAPWVVTAIAVSAIAAVGASLLGSVFAFSRLAFAMGRSRELPFWFSRLNRRQAPLWGLLVPSIIVLALAATGLMDQLIILTVVAACTYYGMIFAAFLRLRQKEPDLCRPYRARAPKSTAVIGLASGSIIFSACLAMDIIWALLALAMLALLGIYRAVAVRSRRFLPVS